MNFTQGLKATGNIVQATPQDLFDRLSTVFRFSLDVCALPENAKCHRYFTPEIDGLKQKWSGGVWCNPPYGKEIGLWVQKACSEIKESYCDFIVMLLPARTDTRWFQDYVLGKSSLYFLKGRLKFGDSKTGAPFPSVIAVYTKFN